MVFKKCAQYRNQAEFNDNCVIEKVLPSTSLALLGKNLYSKYKLKKYTWNEKKVDLVVTLTLFGSIPMSVNLMVNDNDNTI